MSYAIVGFGKIGQALARAFARKNVDVFTSMFLSAKPSPAPSPVKTST